VERGGEEAAGGGEGDEGVAGEVGGGELGEVLEQFGGGDAEA
jgi:hypothetical protein